MLRTLNQSLRRFGSGCEYFQQSKRSWTCSLPKLTQRFHSTGNRSQENCFATLDIGSGEAKLVVARVPDLHTERPEKLEILFEDAVEVELAHDLNKTGTNYLSQEILLEAEDILSGMVDTSVNRYGVPTENIIGFGTQVFRTAENGPAFLSSLHDSLGIDIEIASHNKESAIGFATASALYRGAASREDLVCWDTGAGSFQFSAFDHEPLEARLGNSTVCAMLSVLKKLPVTSSSNPVTAEEVAALDAQIMDYLNETFPAMDEFWIEKWKSSKTKVVGIGGKTSAFATCIHALRSQLYIHPKEEDNFTFTVDELNEVRTICLDRKDTDFMQLNFLQGDIVVQKLSLMSQVMEKFGIKEVQYLPSNGGCLGYLGLELEKRYNANVKL